MRFPQTPDTSACCSGRHNSCHRPLNWRTSQIGCRRKACSGAASGPACRATRSPVVILPAFLSSSDAPEYGELQQTLCELGHPTEVIKVSFSDWVPVLRGGSFSWYLSRAAPLVRRLADEHGAPVSLVGISAGGWLARLAVGSAVYDGCVWGLGSLVSTVITLGSPHQSLEAYPFGRVLEKREGEPADLPLAARGSSLQYANHMYPDAASLAPTRLVCAAGSTVRGCEGGWREAWARSGGSVAAFADLMFINSSYEANCGRDDVDGDGVCPVETAMVPGAEQLILPGVWHSTKPGRQWYGSRGVVEQWDALLP